MDLSPSGFLSHFTFHKKMQFVAGGVFCCCAASAGSMTFHEEGASLKGEGGREEGFDDLFFLFLTATLLRTTSETVHRLSRASSSQVHEPSRSKTPLRRLPGRHGQPHCPKRNPIVPRPPLSRKLLGGGHEGSSGRPHRQLRSEGRNRQPEASQQENPEKLRVKSGLARRGHAREGQTSH